MIVHSVSINKDALGSAMLREPARTSGGAMGRGIIAARAPVAQWIEQLTSDQ